MVEALTLLRAIGAHVGPSMVRTLPGALDVVSGAPKVLTLPDASDVCPEALQGEQSPWSFGFGLYDPTPLQEEAPWGRCADAIGDCYIDPPCLIVPA